MMRMTQQQIEVIFNAARGRSSYHDLLEACRDLPDEEIDNFMCLIKTLNIMEHAEYIMEVPANYLPL